jgi:hypothetical protein
MSTARPGQAQAGVLDLACRRQSHRNLAIDMVGEGLSRRCREICPRSKTGGYCLVWLARDPWDLGCEHWGRLAPLIVRCYGIEKPAVRNPIRAGRNRGEVRRAPCR